MLQERQLLPSWEARQSRSLGGFESPQAADTSSPAATRKAPVLPELESRVREENNAVPARVLARALAREGPMGTGWGPGRDPPWDTCLYLFLAFKVLTWTEKLLAFRKH